MWGILTTVFLGLYLVMSFYIGRRGWTTLGKPAAKPRRVIYWVSFGILIFSFPLMEFFGHNLTGSGWLTLWGWYTMLAVVYLSMLILLIDILILLDKRVNFLSPIFKENPSTPRLISFSILFLVVLILIYGSWNARHPVVTRYDLSLPKKAAALDQLTIAMVSDIHYGSLIEQSGLEQMVETINGLQPELIVLAGDLMEGNTSQEESRKFLETVKQFTAKYGVFAVGGNHDRWSRNEEGLRSFREAGIEALCDEQIIVANSLNLVGRNDQGYSRGAGRKELTELLKGADSNLPVVLLDHQPLDVDLAAGNNIDLQLSGHTHGGQIFPSNLITGLLYKLDWGLLTKDNYHLIVSSGYGTWGPPLRIGSQAEVIYIIIHFVPGK